MFAAGFIFLCYIILPPQKHFRHTLILNLAFADFFNALNNSTSGIYAFRHGSIPAGIACSMNGLIGQWTVQATDFAILFISIATVVTLRKSNYKANTHWSAKVLVTMGIWVVPTVTSYTGLALGAYRPVSGNWCWISSDDRALRYALGHAWRLAIIFSIICLFTYLFIFVHRHFSSMRSIDELNALEGDTDRFEGKTYKDNDLNGIHVYNEFEISEEPIDLYWDSTAVLKGNTEFFSPHPGNISLTQTGEASPPPSPFKVMKQTFHPHISEEQESSSTTSNRINEFTPLLTRDPLALIRRPPPTNITTTISHTIPLRNTIRARETHIQKLLLFNAYPVAYIILWIPGILNRFIELTGHNSRTVAILQASTQFVGLANALVYGYNERIWSLTKMWWKSKRERKESDDCESGIRIGTMHTTTSERPPISWPIGRPVVAHA
ncbi:G protein-coupled glucose receptor regulating Gpa2 domain containing protein [Hyaloscypha variabilis]